MCELDVAAGCGRWMWPEGATNAGFAGQNDLGLVAKVQIYSGGTSCGR